MFEKLKDINEALENNNSWAYITEHFFVKPHALDTSSNYIRATYYRLIPAESRAVIGKNPKLCACGQKILSKAPNAYQCKDCQYIYENRAKSKKRLEARTVLRSSPSYRDERHMYA